MARFRSYIRSEQAVKAIGTALLPCPDGFRAQGDAGTAMYAAYLLRAQFPDIVRPTIAGIVGILHRVPSEIDLPPPLEHLREKATPDGLTLDALHRSPCIDAGIRFPEHRQVYLRNFLLVLMIMFRPQGLAGRYGFGENLSNSLYCPSKGDGGP